MCGCLMVVLCGEDVCVMGWCVDVCDGMVMECVSDVGMCEGRCGVMMW